MNRSRFARSLGAVAILAAMVATPLPSAAITIEIDYSYDTNGFFGASNPAGQGATARAALEAAAGFFSTILTDSFSRISEPPDFRSSVGTGYAFWDWSLAFDHPATGNQVVLEHQTIGQNEYRMYVGGRNLPGNTLGVGGTSTPGSSYAWNGSWSTAETNQRDQITSNFLASLERGQTSGFATWGGYITFDLDATANWHFDHNTLPPTTQSSDFYSVALHEMAHALGFGSSQEWRDLVSGGFFQGLAAKAANNGSAPRLEDDPTPGHWYPNTMSRILGTNTMQETAMDPNITTGTRKLFTALDAAALTDIGWSVSAPTYNTADFNKDGAVNAPDVTTWRSAFRMTTGGDADSDGDSDGNDLLIWQRRLGQSVMPANAPLGVPEPTAASLATWWGALIAVRRRRHKSPRLCRGTR